MKNLDYGKLLFEYGNVLVLMVLCAVVSFVTMEEQSPRSEAAAERLAETIAGNNPPDATVAILVRSGEGAEKFSGNLETALTNAGLTVTTNVIGNPTAARAVLESQAAPLAAIAADEHMIVFCNELLPKLAGESPHLAKTAAYQPIKHKWPNFLKRDNLLNVLKQISIVAIIAIGMTMVIITAGIDLSVGSLIAFSGVITALTIQQLGGGDPSLTQFLLGSAAGILACAAIGFGTGGLVKIGRAHV